MGKISGVPELAFLMLQAQSIDDINMEAGTVVLGVRMSVKVL